MALNEMRTLVLYSNNELLKLEAAGPKWSTLFPITQEVAGLILTDVSLEGRNG